MIYELAVQVAAMVNAHNRLARALYADAIAYGGEQWVLIEENGVVVGCSCVKMVQWYQAEIGRTCVLPEWRGRGIAGRLHLLAVERAGEMGARLIQCTTRADNSAGIAHARRCGYRKVSSFINARTQRRILVWQKPLGNRNWLQIAREWFQIALKA